MVWEISMLHCKLMCVMEISEIYKEKQRVKDRFLVQAQKYESIFCNRDDLKLQEIIDKLLVVERATLSEDCQDKDNIVADVKSA